MVFEKFKEIIDLMVKSSSNLHKSFDIGLDLIEFTEDYSQTIRLLWMNLLTDEGIEWLDWFLYEKDYIHDGIGRSDINAYSTIHNELTKDEEKIEIVEDLEGLYKYLLENNYFKCEKLK